ncbi:hypothetical protein KKH56_03560 [bacterium]|nr:hypothetical protein [bacterium]
MKLKEFVSGSLMEIFEGVKEVHDKMGKIYPGGMPENYIRQGHFLTTDRKIGSFVEFDVAVTVSEESGTKGGIGVFSGLINLGTSGESSKSDTSLSRVKFQVPIVWAELNGGKLDAKSKEI